MAEAITLSGQMIIKKSSHKINDYVNKLLKNNNTLNYLIYSDTDSSYFELFDILEKYCPKDYTADQKTDFMDAVCKRIESQCLAPLYEKMHKELNCHPENKALHMDREVIAVGADKTGTCGFWTGKKRYALLVNDMEDYRYPEPKMKVMGLASIQSSTPEICRKDLSVAEKMLITDGVEAVRKYIEEVYTRFMSKSPEEIALPKSVSDVAKYVDPKTGLPWAGEWYDQKNQKIRNGGVPIQSSAAVNYNFLINKFGLSKKYQKILDGDKIKFIHLYDNPYRFKVIGFNDVLPEEFGLHKYINYEAHYEKAFLSPLRDILTACSLQLEKTISIDDFF